MNGALLNIINEKGEENIFLYKFNKITTYNKLLKDFPKICKINKKDEITFIYNDVKNSYKVTDLNSYILIGDRIDVKIKSGNLIYFLFEISSQTVIKKSYDISELYEFYNEYFFESEILLYKRTGNKVKLVDVLDSASHYQNNCINRMIKNYNY